MILVDFSNLVYRSLFSSVAINKGASTSDQYGGLMIHILLQSIEFVKNNYNQYGEVVLCIDSHITWRSDIYPKYKRNRVKDSKINWPEFSKFFANLLNDLKDCFSYHMFKVDNVEADDIIYHLAVHNPLENHLIVSEDKDFIQLLKYSNIKLYRPIKKEFVVEKDIDKYVLHHICLGDKSDNIPTIMDNIKLSDNFIEFLKANNIAYNHPSNTLNPEFKNEKIQDYYENGNPIWKNGGFGPKTCENFLAKNDFNSFDPKVKQRFIENRNLIDLSYIPKEYSLRIAKVCIFENRVINKQKQNEFFNKWSLVALRSAMNLDDPESFNDWFK